MNTTQHKKHNIDLVALSGPGLRTFFQIVELWNLSEDEQIFLMGVKKSKYYNLKKNVENVKLSQDTIKRISYTLSIYKALQILLPDNKAADTWIKKPNNAPLFSGKSALEYILSGKITNLHLVAQHLNAQRGGWS